jgi:hypothetical protein
MAISNADITALPDYTDSELLKLYRSALANGWAGTSRTINGRSITFAGPKELRDTIEWLEERINADSTDASGGIALVRYGERV